MARRFNRRYGVTHTFPETEPYSAQRHHQRKMQILEQHVRDIDWVMQVDADEFVLFPGQETAHVALEVCESIGATAYIGMLVDRMAPRGNIQQAVAPAPSLFSQYPVNCALTTMMQSSDVRKISAYRGSLRTCSGNHNVIGYNETVALLLAQARPPNRARIMQKMMAAVRLGLGEEVFAHFPDKLSLVRIITSMASVFHFKWTRGVAGKLRRRLDTEPGTSIQYEQIREVLGYGSEARLNDWAVATYCKSGDPPGAAPRALEAWELSMLLVGAPQGYAKVQMAVKWGIARQDNMPLL